MATPNTQITPISEKQEQSILEYSRKAQELLMNQFQLRTNLEEVDRYYQRENDFTDQNIRGRLASRSGDKSQRVMQNITVPIIMPQVRAALGYLANVFLTGYPIFGVSGDPDMEDAALQMETIIAENSVTAGWTRQLMLFFLDGLKYNLHAVECEWQQKTVANIENDATKQNGAGVKNTIWAGNVLKRMDMYNTFFDPRVHPAEIHSEGEFAGYIELYSRMRMKKYINELFGKISPDVVKRAFESGGVGGGSSAPGTPYAWYQPIINPFAIMGRQNQQVFDWMAWSQNTTSKSGIRYQNVYQVQKLYARIIPSDFDFNVPEKNTPQVWKFIVVNNSVVLYGERQSNAHNFIPIFFGQPLEDGLDFQTKSFAQNVTDMQDIASAMWNGYIASKRRLVGDRVLYDPLRIREKDINNTNPAAKIPVRPSAYGKPVAESVYQFPYHDEQTQTLLNGAQLVSQFADKVNNVNAAQQGQFTKGNRTKTEFDDIMQRGDTGNQMMGLMTENQVFIPMKEAIKLNILQYQEETVLYNRDKQTEVNVKPTDIRTAAVHFKISDGITPAEKELDSDEFQTTIQTALQAPALGAGMDITSMFVYLMKTKGADLRPFMKSPAQMQYEGAMQQWQQMAQLAIQKGAAFNSPQPQPSPEYQAEMAGKQRNPNQVTPQAKIPPSPTSAAAEATQGVTVTNPGGTGPRGNPAPRQSSNGPVRPTNG